MPLVFTKAQIRRYLAEMGYEDVEDDQLHDFMKDLRKLIKHDEKIRKARKQAQAQHASEHEQSMISGYLDDTNVTGLTGGGSSDSGGSIHSLNATADSNLAQGPAPKSRLTRHSKEARRSERERHQYNLADLRHMEDEMRKKAEHEHHREHRRSSQNQNESRESHQSYATSRGHSSRVTSGNENPPEPTRHSRKETRRSDLHHYNLTELRHVEDEMRKAEHEHHRDHRRSTQNQNESHQPHDTSGGHSSRVTSGNENTSLRSLPFQRTALSGSGSKSGSLPTTSSSISLEGGSTSSSQDSERSKPKYDIPDSVKRDPVALYHYYNSYWTKHKTPGSDKHMQLRWNVRAGTMGKVPCTPCGDRVNYLKR